MTFHDDYEEFLNLSSKHNGYILMINGKLEDTAIGIGSIGRDRKKKFISSLNFIRHEISEILSFSSVFSHVKSDFTLFPI